MPGRLCLLQNPCWELLERREARGSSVRAVGSRGAAGTPFPGPGHFLGARFAAATPACQGGPVGAEAPRDPGKRPFPGKRLGSAAAEGSRGSFGGGRLRNDFLFILSFLRQCGLCSSNVTFTLSLSPVTPFLPPQTLPSAHIPARHPCGWKRPLPWLLNGI